MMKKRDFILVLFVIHFCSMMYAQKSDYEKIMDNVRADVWSAMPSNLTTFDTSVDTDLSTMKTDGSWTGIDYTDTSGTLWAPFEHLKKLKKLAIAYTLSRSKHYQSATLFPKIEESLKYWGNYTTKSTNWWWNEIASPKELGVILILLRDGASKIPSAVETPLLTQMGSGRTPDKEGLGANKIDIATHYVYRGVLTQDATVLKTGVDEAFLSIALTDDEEGLQHDYSFRQHGPQMAIFSYGAVFLKEELSAIGLLQGTGYALPQARLSILIGYARNAVLKIFRGKYADFSTVGRGISRENATKGTSFVKTIEKLKALDPANAAEYEAAIERLKGTQGADYMVSCDHTQFWRSDYTVHSRDKYSFSVRTSSTRVEKTEHGNKENLKGIYLADGGSAIRVDGDEYDNIFPVWDWNKVPGITVPELATLTLPAQWGVLGKSTFTGGVSDGKYGATAYKQEEYDTPAKKGWFFFDDEVVCLGAEISSTVTESVSSTVNQSLLKGDVTVSENGSTTMVSKGTHSKTGVNWILHNKIGYVFPQGGNIKLSNQSQSGTWKSINAARSGAAVSKEVFKLWIDHGKTPTDGSYVYIVVPDTADASAMQSYNQNNIVIEENTGNIQAVKHTGLDMLQVIFYEAGTYNKNGITIKVDQPCIMLLKKISTASVEVHVADPTQKVTTINASMEFPMIATLRSLQFTMPTNSLAGSSTSLTLDVNSPIKVAPSPYTGNTSVQRANIPLKLKKDMQVYLEENTNMLVLSSVNHLKKVEITGINGRVAASYDRLNVYDMNIDMSNYPKGVYIVRILDEKNQLITEKVLKI
ncbi:Chondroitinase-AC precursor containing a C-terminal secretion signal, family PL8_3 [Tenacibaculum maritimum]|uniref:polysaccharide lyase family 8 super-sandwich domain-containing protein n=1 Tax=Tenacibaculum maritimum TaxID=107401 RepID=UPI0012E5BF8D|nr:polysaccharide lyase family 8 super-sandwich domain-containing protein [Tenacibaculum maritimum]CAA0202836.1 Chondroitinase-AC precursor containing a C-terminal secretion signal, family PL8_3 [Tenacibaculum maritimum]